MKTLVSFLALAILLVGCEADALVNVHIDIPKDTVETVRSDTLPAVVDTFWVTDTLPPVTDTLWRVDTLPPVTDTLTWVRDSVIYTLEGYITNDERKQLDLGSYSVPPHEGLVEVWVEVELSGKHQKDEAFVLLKDGVPISDYACPVNPDNPTLGTDWIRMGKVNEGGEISAQHAKLWSCYPSNTGFQTANSVWFKRLKFVYFEYEVP